MKDTRDSKIALYEGFFNDVSNGARPPDGMTWQRVAAGILGVAAKLDELEEADDNGD